MGSNRIMRWAAAGAVAATIVAAAGCTDPGGPPPVTPPTAPPTTAPAGLPSGHWNLRGDLAVHDPSIIREGRDWYVFSTGPGIQVLRSTDGGTTWGRAPQIFLSPPAWWATAVPNQQRLDVWAPDATVHNGRVWLYYAISSFGSRNSAIGLASASTIGEGRWRDEGMVLRTTDASTYNAIDPELVIDAQGSPWLAFGSFWDGLKLTRLGTNMKPTGGLTSIARRADAGGAIEAPSIVYRDGYYYLFASIDRCCQGVNSTYKIVVGRSPSITGPYVDRSGRSMMDGGGTVLDSGNTRWKGPGGEDVILGGAVIARHAYDATDNGNPKLLISTLRWSDGWPGY